MTETQLLPIALLYVEGREAVEGATRMQKLVFLMQEETEAPETYEYRPGQFGPFSPELAGSLAAFERKGYIERETVPNAAGHEKYIYSLTPEGIQVAKKMLKSDSYSRLFDHATEIKERFNTEPLDDLLQYVYGNYEELTTDTELDTDRLFDPEADSEFLEPEVEEERINVDAYLSDPETFQNDDGSWTARDNDHELTALGSTEAEARENLAEVIAAAEGEGGSEVTDEDLIELGVDPEQARDDSVESLPGFMQ
jgi:uncharacterized protein YwgA